MVWAAEHLEAPRGMLGLGVAVADVVMWVAMVDLVKATVDQDMSMGGREGGGGHASWPIHPGSGP